MKILLSAVLGLLLSFAGHAQTLPTDSTGRVEYRGAIKLPAGVTTTQAFGRAKLWQADKFASKVLLAEDAPSGLLSGMGQVPLRDFLYTFHIRMQVESGQVRYRLYDFTWHTSNPNQDGTVEQQRDSKLAVGRGIRAKLLAELDQKVRAGLAGLSTDLTGAL